MKKIYLVIFSLVLVVGIAIIGYIKAVPGVKDKAQNKPQIEISPLVYDFGEIDYGFIAKHTFRVKNTGEEVLEIKKVITSCACTFGRVEEEILSPGEETNLNVEYETGLMEGSHAKGDQERIIYVRTNDPVNPQFEVKISAYVK